jgi:hypothetical protein
MFLVILALSLKFSEVPYLMNVSLETLLLILDILFHPMSSLCLLLRSAVLNMW